MTHNLTLRPIQSGDIAALSQIADATLFPGDMLPDMVQPVLDGEADELWLTAVDGGTPLGFCFAAPEQMTNGTWNMRALAVAPDAHRRGVGRALVEALQDMLIDQGARTLVVDTASDDDQIPARAFYANLGYHQSGTIPSFWDEGSDKVTFWKALSN